MFFSPLPFLLVILVGVLVGGYFLLKNFVTKRRQKIKNGEVKKYNIVFKILVCLGCIVDFLIVGFVTNWSFSPEAAIGIIALLFIPGIITQCLYFLPYMIANSKGHTQETAIFVLNLFAGWTIIAWIIALIWAFTNKEKVVFEPKSSSVDEIRKLKELLDMGAITTEEFEVKKHELLKM